MPLLIVIIHAVLAVLYTTPWDNYLISSGIWYYDKLRVTGITIGYIPLEEYLFFILQTTFTGIWTILIKAPIDNIRKSKYKDYLWYLIFPCIIFVGSVLGIIDAPKKFLYMVLITGWAIIPIFIQWIFGIDILIFNIRNLSLAIIPPTIYLWIVDFIAIKNNIWTINSQNIINFNIGSLPFEEMLFFLLTNVIIACGVVLMLDRQSTKRVLQIYQYIRQR